MSPAVPVIAGLIEAINRDLPAGDRWSLEYWQRSDAVWSSEKTWQEHIVRTSDPLCSLVICLFGERLGEPLPAYFPWPDDLALPEWASWPDAVEGKAQITGTLFELLDAVNGPRHPGTTRKTLTLFKASAPDFAKGNTEARDRGYGFNHEWDRLCQNARRPPRQLELAYDRQIEQLDLMAQNFFRSAQRPWSAFGSIEQTPDECLEDLRKLLAAQLPRLLGVETAPPGRKMAKGLLSYGPDDADILFGRDAAISRLFTRLSALAEARTPPGPFLLLSGRSGEGKSSLLRAGLIGRLRKGSFGDSLGPFVAVDTDAGSLTRAVPELALANAIQATLGEALLPGHALSDFSPDQRLDKLAGAVIAALDRRPPIGGRKARLFLGVDQLDDILLRTEHEPALRDAVLSSFALLRALVDTGRVWIVAAVSTGMLDRLNQILPGHGLPVEELTRAGEQELREVIERSFAALRLPEDEIERILNEGVLWLRTELDPGPVLPLLSALMAELQRASQEPASFAIGEGAGDTSTLSLAGVLDRLGERAWRQATGGVTAGWNQRLERLLRQLVVTQLGENLNLGLRDCDENHAAVLASPELVQSLREQRLLHRTPQGKYRLPHASIIRSWKRARQLYEEDRRHQITLAEMEQKALRWREAAGAGNPQPVVTDEVDLDRIEDLWFHWKSNLERLPVDFLRASLLAGADRFVNGGSFRRSDGGSRINMALAIDDPSLVEKWLQILDTSEGARRDASIAFQSQESGSTALHNAAAYGSARSVEWLLAHGGDAAATNHKGMTPLHGAAASGQKDAVDRLMGLSDLAARTSNGWNPLHFAAHFGHIDIVRQLIGKSDPEARTNEQRTPLHFAARGGHDEIVRLLLGKTDVDMRAEREFTALHLASEKGHEAVVQALLDGGADTEAKAEQLFTPLHLAAHFGQEAVVRHLLGRADHEARSDRQWTPLHFAAQSGHLGVLRLLLDRVDPAARTNRQFTALHLAAQNGHVEAVGVLLEKSDPNAKASMGWTALHLAVHGGNEELVHLLLKTADINARTDFGATPLFVAVEGGHLSVAEALLHAGADPELDVNGISPLSVALAFARETLIAMLGDAGADEAKAATAVPGYLSDPSLSVDGILDARKLGLSDASMQKLHEAIRTEKPATYPAWRSIIGTATTALGGDPTWELMRMDALRTLDTRDASISVGKARARGLGTRL